MNDSLPVVRLRDHIDLRLRSLQQRYPDLELDVALLSSQRLSSTSGAMRSTFYNYEALEVVTLTRGRRCVEKTTNSSSVTTCSTVFVDDYRYERDIVQTSLVDWYGIIAMLRGGAQTYVWIRLLLLVYGAYTASGQSAAEKLNSSSRFASTALIVFKIPFQVIVYSSLLPVSAYVGALILDSSFTDIFLDSYWASVGGAVNFKLVPFIRTTSVEMRGVWSLALFASVVLFAMRRSRYYDEGISGIRGLLISFTSSLTVFGPYKSIRYRDMDIVSVFQMPDGGQTMDIVQSSNPAGCYNISSYIYGGSSKTVRLCLVAVAAFALIFKALGYLTPRRTWTYRATRGMIFRTSNVAPCGTESLWKTTSPMIHFSVPTRPQQSRNTISTAELNSAHTSPMKSHTTGFSTPRVAPLSLLNLSIAGLSHRRMSTDPPPLRQPRRYPWNFCSEKRDSAAPESIESSTGGLGSRTIAAHSILQLMNIAMMTDPWNFFWLRVIGIPLYLYHVRPTPSTGNSSSVLPYAVILPYAEDEMEERTGLSCEDFDLLDSASSRDVPMSVLLQCG
ncbi:hypothetical protein KRP22_007470 [Phytophthora ramorum]|nr:hypothetical protein KRP22_4518 [Phytophthora ramorum]